MRAVIVLPTYNERENLPRFVNALRSVSASVDVLVIDDSSPDGTGALARDLARSDGGIDVVERPDRSGLGSAYRDGFARALADGYDVVLSMDADLSHDPADIATMMRLLSEGADIVVGSRYVDGGGTADWSLARRWLSRGGNRYARTLLRLPVRDCTSGYRAYRREALVGLRPAATSAEGYAFLIELSRRTAETGATVVETPIIFRDRTRGASKMSISIVVESMLLVTRWGCVDAGRRVGRRVRSRLA